MIEISQLDPSKTYVGYEVGTSKVAKKIQAFSKRDAEKIFSNNTPNESDIASHTFALVWNKETTKWFVYESHFHYDGVKKISYDSWLQLQKKDAAKRYYVFPLELSIGILEYYEKYNIGYGSGSIADLSLGEIAKQGGLSWFDYPGVICAEYLAQCDIDYKICNKFGRPPHKIRPVHFQAYSYEVIGKDNLIEGYN